jgi:hypothetical protein
VAGPYLQLRDLAPKLGVGRCKAHVVGLLVVVGGALHAPRPDNLQKWMGRLFRRAHMWLRKLEEWHDPIYILHLWHVQSGMTSSLERACGPSRMR